MAKFGRFLYPFVAGCIPIILLFGFFGVGRGESPKRLAPHGLPATHRDFFLPGTQPGTLQQAIPDPASCNVCHNEPIYDAWRGSMMANAGRDPIFWAALEVANEDVPGVGDFCLRCHTPKGWLEGRSHPADGSALQAVDIHAGVACEICHRMVDPVPGATDETAALDIAIRAALTSTLPANHVGNAMLILDPLDNRRGPFALPQFPFHAAFQADFQGNEGNYVTRSRLCGSCHNVNNPLLSWNENPPGGGPPQYWPNKMDAAAPSFGQGALFPIESTFDEWLNSSYATTGVFAPQFAGEKRDGLVGACQDCHMPRQTGYAADNLSPTYPIFRDCQTTGCLPAHVLVGGNAWVPQILQDERWRLNAAADATYLDATTQQARAMLQRAATLTVELQGSGAQRKAVVRVVNETGHKLPTGYPEGRRMWINLRAYDAADRLIYESGLYNPQTAVLANGNALKVYEVKQGMTPELAAEVGLQGGPSFHFVLNNTVYKDNRIPPRGYTTAAYDRPGLRPVGASYAGGQYWDDTVYAVPAATVRVVATLYYQTSSADYIDFLRTNGGADAATLGALWDDSKSPPEVMATAVYLAEERFFIPVVGR